mmetsp:Transcript_15451/g.42503  ORF Transcript_15451/g.42503 Transcript_15451/m.42503 type:complete len:523 (-) Transcript_15451:59-1627(-)
MKQIDDQDDISASLRSCLVDVVDKCLRHKPEHLSSEEYFAEGVEPLLRCLMADCIVSKPDDLAEFVHRWVARRANDECIGGAEHASPLAHLASWSARRREQDRDRELAELRRRFELLAETLNGTDSGREVLRAVMAGDRGALASALRPSGLASQEISAPTAESRETRRAGPDVTTDFSSVLEYTGGATEIRSLLDVPAISESLRRDAAAGNRWQGNTAETLGVPAEAFHSMGVVLHALRNQGISSAAAAFKYFGPDNDQADSISCDRLLAGIERLGTLSSRQTVKLLQGLDRRGSGRVTYNDFKGAVVGFLASSSEFHSELSTDELVALVGRIQLKLSRLGLTVGKGFASVAPNSRGELNYEEFVGGLKVLRLGLSHKEIAQVFNAVRHNGSNTVRLEDFEAMLGSSVVRDGISSGIMQWGAVHFAQLHSAVGQAAIEAHVRRYAAEPDRRHLSYASFSAIVSDAAPRMSSTEVARLWSLLDKVDDVEECVVDVLELVGRLTRAELVGRLARTTASPSAAVK